MTVPAAAAGPAFGPPTEAHRPVASAGPVVVRTAVAAEALALYQLISANLEVGWLLPRTLPEITVHAARFVVAVKDEKVVGCAELAPLSRSVAEVRSLVVDEGCRGAGVGTRLVEEIRRRAQQDGRQTLCAFTHDPALFVRLGFSIVPHVWVPEKIATDCRACPLFRRCGQFAMVLPLAERPLFRRSASVLRLAARRPSHAASIDDRDDGQEAPDARG